MTSRANGTNHIALPNALSALDIDRAQVTIQGLKTVAMIDHDHIAITIIVPSGVDDHASVRCIDTGAKGG